MGSYSDVVFGVVELEVGALDIHDSSEGLHLFTLTCMSRLPIKGTFIDFYFFISRHYNTTSIFQKKTGGSSREEGGLVCEMSTRVNDIV